MALFGRNANQVAAKHPDALDVPPELRPYYREQAEAAQNRHTILRFASMLLIAVAIAAMVGLIVAHREGIKNRLSSITSSENKKQTASSNSNGTHSQQQQSGQSSGSSSSSGSSDNSSNGKTASPPPPSPTPTPTPTPTPAASSPTPQPSPQPTPVATTPPPASPTPTPNPSTVPNTGPGDTALMAAVVSGAGASALYYIRRVRTLRSHL